MSALGPLLDMHEPFLYAGWVATAVAEAVAVVMGGGHAYAHAQPGAGSRAS